MPNYLLAAFRLARDAFWLPAQQGYLWVNFGDGDFEEGTRLLNVLVGHLREIEPRFDPAQYRIARGVVEEMAGTWRTRFGDEDHQENLRDHIGSVGEIARTMFGDAEGTDERRLAGIEATRRAALDSPIHDQAQLFCRLLDDCKRALSNDECAAFDLGKALGALAAADRRFGQRPSQADLDRLKSACEGRGIPLGLQRLPPGEDWEPMRRFDEDLTALDARLEDEFKKQGRPRLILCPETATARLDDVPIDLPTTCIDLIMALASANGETVEHARLMQLSGIGQGNLDTYISRTRRILKDAAGSGPSQAELEAWVERLITSVKTRGYRLGVHSSEIAILQGTPPTRPSD